MGNISLIIDVEATCFDDGRHSWLEQETIEIGATLLNRDSLVLNNLGSVYINPKGEISDFCTNLTGLTKEFLANNGTTFITAIGKLMDRIDETCGYPVNSLALQFCSWGDWDHKQLMLDCARNKMTYPFDIETAVNVKRLFWGEFCKIDTKQRGLDHAITIIGETFTGIAHRGQDDAYNTAVVYKHILQHITQGARIFV